MEGASGVQQQKELPLGLGAVPREEIMLQRNGARNSADHIYLATFQSPEWGEESRSGARVQEGMHIPSYSPSGFTQSFLGARLEGCPIIPSPSAQNDLDPSGVLQPLESDTWPNPSLPSLHPQDLTTVLAMVIFTLSPNQGEPWCHPPKPPRARISPDPVGKLEGIGDGGTQKDDGDVVREHDEHLLPHNPTLGAEKEHHSPAAQRGLPFFSRDAHRVPFGGQRRQ